MSTSLRSGICDGYGKGEFAEVRRKARFLRAGPALNKRRTVIRAITRCRMESYLTMSVEDGTGCVPSCSTVHVVKGRRNRYVELAGSDRCILVAAFFARVRKTACSNRKWNEDGLTEKNQTRNHVE
jgi:hypothetical protein